MKQFMRMAVAALVFCSAVNVQAAGDEKNGRAYFTKAELPNMAYILPAPPEFESARFVADQSQYLWGKLMRLDARHCWLSLAERCGCWSHGRHRALPVDPQPRALHRTVGQGSRGICREERDVTNL